MSLELRNDIVFKLHLVLGVLYREHISHFRILSDEFSITDQLTKHHTEGLTGYFNDRHPVVLLIVQKLNQYLSKHN
jgi:hypothetical protein